MQKNEGDFLVTNCEMNFSFDYDSFFWMLVSLIVYDTVEADRVNNCRSF
jgi:hypothetical protein